MCLLVPGKIIAINDALAIVDYGTEQRTGMILEGTYVPGDYVLIQGGIVLQKVSAKEAERSLCLYREATASSAS